MEGDFAAYGATFLGVLPSGAKVVAAVRARLTANSRKFPVTHIVVDWAH